MNDKKKCCAFLILIERLDVFVHLKLAQRVNLIKNNNKHEKIGG
jgi:hypothetical protein